MCKTKDVNFKYSSDSKNMNYDVTIQQKTDESVVFKMEQNNQSFPLKENEDYVVMVRGSGNPGDKFKIDVSGAKRCNTPIECEIPNGEDVCTNLQSITA